MAQVSKYRYLLNQYPETVQKEQFRIICHISKRTARYLLQSGLVPCVQSGKKTRNYTIKMKDIVRYLERREIHPEKYKLPPGSYSGTYAVKPLLPESVTTEELRKYYMESFRDIPDIVSTREAAELTGATASTVAKWIRTKKLKALSHGPAFIIPKGRQIAALFTPYGDREYQGDLLYRTRLHGEDGISFFFDEGYTYIPWNGLAFLLDAMIEDGDYPNPVVEEQPDPIGDYNIPDEVDEMGGPHRQMTIGEADFDYVLDAVAYEAGETVVEPVKPQAIVQMENDTPAAGDEPASVPDENPPVVVEAPETARPTDTAEQPTPPPVKGNTTAHKNFRRFQELFPEIVSGQYEYLRLEAGEAYYPLVIHHKYGSHYCMEHYYI